MKKIEELKMLEVEAMSEFQEHISLVLTHMEILRNLEIFKNVMTI